MNKCIGIAGWFFGHAYEPAFDVRPGPVEVKNARSSADLMQIVEANAERIYKGHVCRRCGARVMATTDNKEQ